MIALHSFGKGFCAIFFWFYAIFCRLDPVTWIANLLIGNMVFWWLRNCHSLAQVVSKFSLWKSQSQNFADFDIKIILLRQNSFEWLAFCSVEYCAFQNYIESLKYFVIVTWSWLFQLFNWIICNALSKKYKIFHL